MSALLDTLSATDLQALRATTREAEDIQWPVTIARVEGWVAANAEYHRRQRNLGRAEMEALMAAAHVDPGVDADTARELIITATELYLHTEGVEVASSIEDGELHLYATRCPVYERFLDISWGGLTACGCFARRQGWFEALKVDLEEEVVMNRKWGDLACAFVIRSLDEVA